MLIQVSLSDLLLVAIFSISIGLVWGYVIWGAHHVPIIKNYFKIQLKRSDMQSKLKQVSPNKIIPNTLKPLPKTNLSVSSKELQKISDQIDQLI